MPTKYKIIIGLLAFILIEILVLQVDDSLEPEAKTLYTQAIKHKESKAYIYLLGIQAAATENPAIVGKTLLQSIKQVEKKVSQNNCISVDYKTTGYPQEEKLPLLNLDSCTKDKCTHTEKLFAHRLNSKEMKTQKVLYERYNKFMKMRDYHTLALPHSLAPLPPYTYIMNGSDLISLMAIDRARNGDREAATTMLLHNISDLRHHLEQADNLVHKMIFVSAISKTIDVLSVLRHKNQAFMVKLESLSLEERSLTKALSYEFAVSYNFLKSMNGCRLLDKKNNSPAWLNNLFYKSNMSINALLPLYTQSIQESHMSNDVFADEVILSPEFKADKSHFRNYIGSILNEDTPYIKKYVAGVFSLDAKIQLYNKTANKVELPSNLDHIKNPFYKVGNDPYYSKNKKKICFDLPLMTPLDDHRCLRVNE